MQFLKKGLIDLNGSDEKLDKLIKTTASVVELLDETPSKALAYTLIALDPQSPEDDPVVKEIIAVLESNWTTYFNTFSGTPVQVVRAILLQALADQSDKDQCVAIAFVSIVRNMLPKMEVGNESDMWGDLVGRIEYRLNAKAEEEWATPEKIKVKPFVYDHAQTIEIVSTEVVLDRESLETEIQKASGPSNPQGQGTNGNTVWANSGQAWVNQFTPLMTAAIADTVDAALAEAQIEPIDLSKPLKDLSLAVATHIDSTLNAVVSIPLNRTIHF
ncbi:GTPase-associated system all-helical protein GASH [Erwinia aphidicola]|uniref:GTPase-associated system all-helical protein GASH n=1 Tax=Erwinia aphidicola TaxID=68334 RepID=UPI00300CF8EE